MLILSNLDIKLYEIPVLEILSGFTMTEKILYEIAIVAAIFTSEISAGFGILENIREKRKIQNRSLDNVRVGNTNFIHRIRKASGGIISSVWNNWIITDNSDSCI